MDPRLLFVNLNSRARPPRTHVTSTLQTTSLPQPTRTPTTPALSNRVLYGEGIHYRLRRFRLAGARRTVSLTGLRPAPRTRVRSARTPSTSSRTLFTGTSWVRARPNRVLNGSNPFSRAPSSRSFGAGVSFKRFVVDRRETRAPQALHPRLEGGTPAPNPPQQLKKVPHFRGDLF